MQRAISLMQASEIKMLLNLPLIILVLTIKILRNVKTLIMLMLFLEQARRQWCSQHENLFWAKYFDFLRATVVCLGQHLSKRKTKNARNLVAMPFGYVYVCGQPAWSLRATWRPWAPHWWPLIVFFSTYDLVWS